MKAIPLAISSEKVHGFNYQPSYSANTFDTWRHFDESVFRREISTGKNYFPKMNVLRIWLSWNAWSAGPEAFKSAFSCVLDICGSMNLMVIPVLYNRWHDPILDCDGIYLDHFLPGSSWLLKYGLPGREYTADMGKTFGKDPRILVWDLCNEPFAYDKTFLWRNECVKYEMDWLRTVNDDLRSNGGMQPVGIGTLSAEWDPVVNELVDCFLTHHYLWMPADKGEKTVSKERIEKYRKGLQESLDYVCSVGKPMISTETVWGAFDDAVRTDLINATCAALKEKNIGFLAHALYESDVTDLHAPENGRLSKEIGHLDFIRKDGTLRPGHDAINRYMD